VDERDAKLLGLTAERHEYPGGPNGRDSVVWYVADARGALGSWVETTGSCRVLNVVHVGIDGAAALALFAAAVRVKGVGR
jgi:hypothetical protein